jgi:hypothetical protein
MFGMRMTIAITGKNVKLFKGHYTKSLVSSLATSLGYELCRLNRPEAKWKAQHGVDFDFRNLMVVRSLAAMSQLTLAECHFLGDLIRSSDPTKPIIEIGSLYGWSTLVITLFKAQSQPLITVDNYSWNSLGMTPEAHFTATRMRLAEATRDYNVRQIRMDKDEFYRTYDGAQPALFFCDADHGYEATKADLVWARSVNAKIICGDDYSQAKFPGVVRAVEEMGGAKKVDDELFLL